MRGLEPPTPGTTIQCSNQLSYNHRQISDPSDRRFRILTPGKMGSTAKLHFSTLTPGNSAWNSRIASSEILVAVIVTDSNPLHFTNSKNWESVH